jgi:hypothetical protein
MNALFKEVDLFKVYGQYAIDLKKQIVEGAKEQLLTKRRHRTKKEVQDEINNFTLEEEATNETTTL